MAYMENLMEVLPAVRTLLTEIPGKTVVTSDHGQLIGDSGFPVPIREYGHPNGIYQEEVVKVPWHVYQNGPRKSIVAEPGDENSYGRKDREEIDEKAKEHLENLGYL
jgi:hypothetical protein